MPETEKPRTPARGIRRKISTFFARALGVRSKRKAALFLDLSRAATLFDLVYWLQIFFSAGIATLGLVLNSPAVIIGAMLISPLMNPILSSGLALASGDLVLGLRAAFNLFLSCAAAIAFAVLLVVLLPFREMTAEIAARTQPNFLDLLIALFSGAVGSVAICREVKGVVTSIPGVAIAVALMPPLCVVGYGIGLMLVFDTATGWRVASGGALLFLTNLVAITLTAMLVFVALRIDTPFVRQQVEAWEQTDAESRFVINSMRRFPGLEQARQIHSLRLRFLMILLPLALILYPLGSAFSQLQNEISQKRRESQLRQIVTDVWQEKFQKNTDGISRSSVDHLAVAEKDGKININLRVFDDQPYTLSEKKECAQLLAERLNRPVDSIVLLLTEIPTVSVLDALRQSREEKPAALAAPQTVAELQENLLERVEIALSDFKLPPPAQILRKQIVTGLQTPLEIKIVYLSDDKLSPETQNSLLERVRQSLDYDQATINLERVGADIGEINFSRNQSALPVLGMMQLDFAGRMLRENPNLTLLVAASPLRRGETAQVAAARTRAIAGYLESRWQIAPAKINSASDVSPAFDTIRLAFAVQENPPPVADKNQPAPQN
ncbi:MAG: DUF389 domain-containing protein [Acidobacteriota bacterium]|nr:DUF389 domain-containing protein [Acidobacteriota bacterium]